MSKFREQVKELCIQFLEEEVSERKFAIHLASLLSENGSSDYEDMKWIAEQLLIVR